VRKLPFLYRAVLHPCRVAVILLAMGGVTKAQTPANPSPITRKYAPAQLKEDAVLFSNVVMAMHPSIGIYQPRAYYQKLFAGFIDSLTDSLTERQFRLKLKLVADELHCGHTEILYSPAYYKAMSKLRLNYSPYVFIPVHEKVFMLASIGKPADSLLKKGVEITRINGIGVDSMLRYSRRFISADGYNTTSRDHYLQLGFNSYYTGLFGRPDTFAVEYSDNGVAKKVSYPAIRPKTLPVIPLGPKGDSLMKRFRRAGIGYRYLDAEQRTMHVRIQKFSSTGEGRAYRKIFRKLRKNKSENLVIDLRNNGGGSLFNAYRLLSYVIDSAKTQTLRTSIRRYPYKDYTRGNIWFRVTRFAYAITGQRRSRHDTDEFIYTIRPRRRNHFGGRLYVLINGGSFSASSLVAAYLRDTRRAKFIGQETGGTLEGCNAGVTPYYRLPNTKLRVRMPAFRVVHDVSPQITGNGILPDYRTEYTFGDIVSRRDLELEKVRELLKIQ
jgi:hypothetical protein